MLLSCLDKSFPRPEENLACDEALLRCAEDGLVGPCLRFWETRDPFVVLGYGNQAATEADLAYCRSKMLPILRRCSGGGTVVQAPGVINYSLVLPARPPFDSITGTNRTIMERQASALTQACEKQVTVEGHTDLAIHGRKISGNAQRRGRSFLLFHGSILLDLDLSLVQQALRNPSRQPAYRQQRSHEEFLLNLELPLARIKSALRDAWDAQEEFLFDSSPIVAELVRSRYSQRDWNYKF